MASSSGVYCLDINFIGSYGHLEHHRHKAMGLSRLYPLHLVEKRHLVSQLFDASYNSAVEQMQRNEEICMSRVIGIVGHLTECGKSLNIPICYEEYHIPSTKMYKLHDLKFDDYSLNDRDMLKACIRMFMDLGLLQRFGIEYDVSKLCHMLEKLETLTLLIACLCHDLDQGETNNSFQKKSSYPLADLYSTSTVEHHHFDQCIMLLNSKDNQILSHLSSEEYKNVVHVLEEAILATDLSYFKKQFTFTQMAAKRDDWKEEDNKELLRAMLMTACDVAAITKPWKIQKKIAELVTNEFFEKGYDEKHLKLEPVALALISEKLHPLLEGVKENRTQWLKLAEEKQNYSSEK
ncbi:dual 3',5'-cyclic-AMP and -GMP phosphodiesterase 11 [Caerostris darwini]|uniref:Dual 3',5'-cyclic-AMP and -GMP phosphodiesterase 11 n=1 Tax=Caerostris darwini TaxID=1538125 RepID=A0AAV4QKC2_9ARAC|nr:dual 3',5'-cyclic-AMP and -GMP phosphodiesterase 11 [Caerostris darwini]